MTKPKIEFFIITQFLCFLGGSFFIVAGKGVKSAYRIEIDVCQALKRTTPVCHQAEEEEAEDLTYSAN